MMEISIWKILLVLLVALVVLGPEQLPKVARTIGRLLGKVRGILSTVQRQLHEITVESEKEKEQEK